MPRRPAIFTQADIDRAARAAKQVGAGGVELRPDGSIFIHLSADKKPAVPVEIEQQVVL